MSPKRFFHSQFLVEGAQRLFLLALIVGVIAGLGAALFHVLLNISGSFLLNHLAGLNLSHPAGEHWLIDFDPLLGPNVWWIILLLPTLGGLIGGYIVYRFAPEAAGHGTDAMIHSFHNKAGKIKGIVPFIKGIATLITLSTGGSAGREGPVAQIGAGFGSAFASKLGLNPRDRRTLLLCGTAGGLGAIFMAPLGGALTAVEVLYKEDFESESLIPCIISSVTAYITYGSIFGFHHIFALPPGTQFATGELLVFIFLGLTCSAIGFVYVKTFYGIRDLFKSFNIPAYFKPAIGGLGVGILALITIHLLNGQILAGGFGFIQSTINHTWEDFSLKPFLIISFFALALFKILATSFTVSTGGSGGVFGPSLYIGAMLGAAVAGLAFFIFPEMMVSPPGAFVIVGMSSFFAGVANAPIAAMVMTSELTGGYDLLAPLMLVSVISIILSRRWSIYENQVKNKFFSKAHVHDMTIDVLQGIRVEELKPFRQSCITTPHQLYHEAERFAQKIHASDFILAEENKAVGMVSLRDVHFNNTDPLISNLIQLEDIMSTKFSVIRPDTNLHEALEILLRSDFDKVPIINQEHQLLGYLLYSDILSKYHSNVNSENTITSMKED